MSALAHDRETGFSETSIFHLIYFIHIFILKYFMVSEFESLFLASNHFFVEENNIYLKYV